MKIIRDRLFFLRAADEKLDLGIALPQIDRADDRVALSLGQRPAPQVDTASVHGGGVFNITVIKLVYDMRIPRMSAALRPVNDDISR